jgi:hypothetical protein
MRVVQITWFSTGIGDARRDGRMGTYDWRRPKPPARHVGYRLALLLLLVGLGLEVGGIVGQDVKFALSGLGVIVLGTVVTLRSAWGATGL